jgi:microsomal dipeptidase-like Zn-dependent dipeptidase
MEFKYADIHVHSSLKPFNSRNYPKGAGKTIWDKFDERKKDLKKLGFIIRNMSKELAKSSQANLDVCVDANLVCPFLALYPVERQWFDVRLRFNPHGRLFPELKKILIRLLLPKKNYPHLGAAFSGFPREFVKKIMVRIEKGDGINYFREELLPQMEYTLNQRYIKSRIHPQYSFRIATNYKKFKKYTSSPNHICGILTVEGMSSLGNYRSHNVFYKEYKNLDAYEKYHIRKDFIKNISALKSWEGGKYTPFFISFCHHFNNLLAGHARSLSAFGGLLDQEPGINKGFNKLGKEVLELLLSRENGRRILIDTKHMSLESRFYYHSFVKQRRKQNDFIPIIQSHSAINGLESFRQAMDYNEEKKDFNDGAYFSRWKMNLNDEEILDVYDSDGIIGIVFHEDKMPGGLVRARTRELSKWYHKLQKKDYLSDTRQAVYDEAKEKLKLIYVELLWSTIFHIIRLINTKRRNSKGKRANGWKIISIGSDYDGMIDPFDGYFSVSDLPSLFNDMMEYIDNDKGPVFYAVNGQIRKFQKADIRKLLFGKTIKDVLRDVCFNNVDKFLSKYFTISYLT